MAPRMEKNYLNLSLRSIFHIFISGSLFYFFQSKFHMGLPMGVALAFITQFCHEIFEHVRRIENTFHSSYVFQRDRILAILAVIYVPILMNIHQASASIIAPASLVLLTSYMDSRLVRAKAETRNIIKPIFDIASFTLGPIAYVALASLINR